MHAKDLAARPPEGHLFRVTGDDPYYLKLAEEYFESLVPEEARSFDFKKFTVYPGAEMLRSEILRIPMFSERNVILVADKETAKSADDGLTKLFNEVPEDCVLVFSGAKFLSPKCADGLTEISAERLGLGELTTEIPKLFPAGITRQAALKLADDTNRDMQRIVNESVKLNAYGNGKETDVRDVETLVSSDAEHDIFEFYELLKRRDRKGAYRVMENLRKKGGEAQYLLSSLIGQYRRMLYGAISPLTNAELAKQLGVKEYAVKKAREAAKTVKPLTLKAQFDRLTDLEFKVRSGGLSSDTALNLALETLLEG